MGTPKHSGFEHLVIKKCPGSKFAGIYYAELCERVSCGKSTRDAKEALINMRSKIGANKTEQLYNFSIVNNEQIV